MFVDLVYDNNMIYSGVNPRLLDVYDIGIVVAFRKVTKKVQVGNDQEMTQPESHSKNRSGEN